MTKKSKALRPIDTPLFRLWQALYLSFYSARLYVDVFKRWHGFGFFYLLLLLCVLSLPMSIKVGLNFNKFYNDWVIAPTIQIPALLVQNGQLIFDKPMPYLIKNKFGKVVTIVDTTGKISTFTEAYPYLVLLVTEKAVQYRTPSPHLFSDDPMPEFTAAPITQSFSKETNEIFNPKLWLESSNIATIVNMGTVLLYPMMVGALFGFYAVFHLAFGMMAQLVSNVFFHFKLTYKQACRLLAIASTPGLTLFFIFYTLNISFFGLIFIITGLISAYFSFAALAVRRESQMIVRS